MGKLDGCVLLAEPLLDEGDAFLNGGIYHDTQFFDKVFAIEETRVVYSSSLMCLDRAGDEYIELTAVHTVEHGVLTNEGRDAVLADDELQSLVAPSVRRITEEELIAPFRRALWLSVIETDHKRCRFNYAHRSFIKFMDQNAVVADLRR